MLNILCLKRKRHWLIVAINQPNLLAQIPGVAMFDCKIHTRYEDIAYLFKSLRKQRNVQGSLPDAVSFGGPLGKRSFVGGVDSFNGAYHYVIIRKLE